MRGVLWFAPLILLPAAVGAQELTRPQPVQELFFTEVVYPQSRHEVQLTLGTFVDRSAADKAALTPVSVEFGVTNRFQIEASWDAYSRFHTDPVAHLRTARTSIGAKYSLMNIGGSHVHAATGLDVEFPRAGAIADGEGEDETEFEPLLALAADIGRGVTIFGSAGLSLGLGEIADAVRRRTLTDDPGTISVGALVAARRVTFAGEYTSRSDQAPWRLGGSPLVTPSAILHPGGEWEIGIGTPIGVRRGARRPGLALHLIKEF